MTSDAVYMRDLDGTGSMHVCLKGDSGAQAYVPERSRLFRAVTPDHDVLAVARDRDEAVRRIMDEYDAAHEREGRLVRRRDREDFHLDVSREIKEVPNAVCVGHRRVTDD